MCVGVRERAFIKLKQNKPQQLSVSWHRQQREQIQRESKVELSEVSGRGKKKKRVRQAAKKLSPRESFNV